MLITFADAYLVVCMAEVDRAEHSGLAKPIEQISNARNRKNIEFGLAV